jgi:hypothetical protein
VVEVARLESVYRFIAYPGFESPSLRQEYKCKKGHPRVAFLHLFHGGEKQSACALCEGDSKAVGLLAAAGSRDVTESPCNFNFVDSSYMCPEVVMYADRPFERVLGPASASGTVKAMTPEIGEPYHYGIQFERSHDGARGTSLR